MAKFELEHAEGMRWIKVTLNGETVRAAEGGSEPHVGEHHNGYPFAVVAGHPDLVSLRGVAVAPYYKGTGELCLESSLGGFHTLELNEGETWVIQNGAIGPRRRASRCPSTASGS